MSLGNFALNSEPTLRNTSHTLYSTGIFGLIYLFTSQIGLISELVPLPQQFFELIYFDYTHIYEDKISVPDGTRTHVTCMIR